jgi:lipoate-protein ligase A
MSNVCRLLPSQIASGPWNMAADEALLGSAMAGIASLRFYQWTAPTLSLGYFQPSDPTRSYPGVANLDWLRRPTGGAALVHHHELTYALALPVGNEWQPKGGVWLHEMHAILQDALQTLGVITRLCTEEQKLGEVLCFLHHTPADVLIEGHKIAGSAQRKRHGALLQHGSVLLRQSEHTPELPGVHELTDSSLSFPTMQDAIIEALQTKVAWHMEPTDWTNAEREAITGLIASRYENAAWNSKR